MPKLNRPPRVYLSPAYHWFNNCSLTGCDETTHNNLYLDEVEPFLDACGIEWMRGPRRVPKSKESGDALMKQAVKESDEFQADIHYVNHTNASVDDIEDIGEGKAKGCRPIIYEGSKRGEDLAKCMINRRKDVYPGKITLNRRTDLYELRAPKAVSFYEEHVFHDNMEDAQWFHANMKNIARSAVQGMCDYFEIPFVEPGESKPADKKPEETKPEDKTPALIAKVGDVVTFTGRTHYTNSGKNAKGYTCKPGQARVTLLSEGNAHPYHLVGIGTCTVHGWVNAADVAKVVTASKDLKVAAAKSKDASAAKGVRFTVESRGGLNFRASASSKSAANIIRALPHGTVVTWYGFHTGSWYLVQLSDKSIGYVHKDYLRKV